jgi:hypothetical protein
MASGVLTSFLLPSPTRKEFEVDNSTTSKVLHGVWREKLPWTPLLYGGMKSRQVFFILHPFCRICCPPIAPRKGVRQERSFWPDHASVAAAHTCSLPVLTMCNHSAAGRLSSIELSVLEPW